MKRIFMVFILATMMLAITGCGSSELASKTGMNSQQEKAAIEIFKSVGISKAEDLSPRKEKDIYIVGSGKFDGLIFKLKEDKNIDFIKYKRNFLYSSLFPQKVVAKFEDFYIENEASYVVAARDAVRARLRSPKSADFNWDHFVTRKDNIVTVKGTLEATNAFNAKIKTSYFVTLSYPDKNVLKVLIN
jgi:hypothetical protein